MQSTEKEQTGKAEVAIRQVLDQLAAAWNVGDAAAFAGHFTEDSDYVTFAGDHLKGRRANEETHRQLYGMWIMKGSTLHGAITQLSFLSDSIALVHGTGTVQLRFQKKPAKGRESLQTYVFVRTAEGWKIRAFHNVRVKPMGFIQKMITGFRRK